MNAKTQTRLWVVGEYEHGYFGDVTWRLVGVFTDERLALDVCTTDLHFLSPVFLDHVFLELPGPAQDRMPIAFPRCADWGPLDWRPEEKRLVRRYREDPGLSERLLAMRWRRRQLMRDLEHYDACLEDEPLGVSPE